MRFLIKLIAVLGILCFIIYPVFTLLSRGPLGSVATWLGVLIALWVILYFLKK